MKQIDLKNFRTVVGKTKSRVFTGRDRGEDVRERSKIDELFSVEDSLEIIIPEDIFSITPSFLEELFKNIAEKYNKDVVLSHVVFKGKYKLIQSTFEEAIDRIIQTKTGLER